MRDQFRCPVPPRNYLRIIYTRLRSWFMTITCVRSRCVTHRFTFARMQQPLPRPRLKLFRDLYLPRNASWARWHSYLEHLLNGYKVFLEFHLSIGAPTLHVLLNTTTWRRSVLRKIRSPGERTNKAVSCSVSPACSARLIKTIRTAATNDKRARRKLVSFKSARHCESFISQGLASILL